MRINEIIVESTELDEIVQDASVRPEYAILISALENLRNNEIDGKDTPRIEATRLIDMVKHIPGAEGFNQALLDAAFKDNETVKSLVKNIKVDPHDGVNYVNLAPAENQIDPGDPLGAQGAPKGDPSNIVSKMANRAATK